MSGVSTTTTTARVHACAEVTDVTRVMAEIATRLPQELLREIDPVMRRCASDAAVAVSSGLAWERAHLDRGIRRDLLDIQRFALRVREPALSVACGRILNDLDRRLQQEASPGFDPAH